MTNVVLISEPAWAHLFHAEFIFICQRIQSTLHVEASPFLVLGGDRLEAPLPVLAGQHNRLNKHITLMLITVMLTDQIRSDSDKLRFNSTCLLAKIRRLWL